MDKILEINDLFVSIQTFSGKVKAVRGVSFDIRKGETLALVGESGSGKSVTSKSIMRLLPIPNGRIEKGKVMFEGESLISLSEKQMQTIRGKAISMIFQDPMTSLNPTMSVGAQISEGIRKHQNLGRHEAKIRVLELFELVGIPKPEERMTDYPHQFSGGMRQRVMIAMALACNPRLLIADEPTTALDVTIQAQILDLLKDVQNRFDTAILLITHDLGVVANLAHRVAVMYAGKIVEIASVEELFYKPKHPYTWGLLASMPKLDEKKEKLFAIAGTPPDLVAPPQGCPFAARCPYTMRVCIDSMPAYIKLSETHSTACWLLDKRAPKVEPPQESVGGIDT